MQTIQFGSPADLILIQPVDDHDLSVMETEIRLIREMTGRDFTLIACKTERWNRDLSPWEAPAVFGDEAFSGGAADFLREILPLCADKTKTYLLGGYSLAGLFALWAGSQTDRFSGIAAASPSVWFPGFSAYLQTHPVKAESVYLSLGDREEKTRHPVMKTVGDCIRADHAALQEQSIACTLEWNSGNHFKEPDRRTAKAFAWLMQSGT